jgi:hypothetical protein
MHSEAICWLCDKGHFTSTAALCSNKVESKQAGNILNLNTGEIIKDTAEHPRYQVFGFNKVQVAILSQSLSVGDDTAAAHLRSQATDFASAWLASIGNLDGMQDVSDFQTLVSADSNQLSQSVVEAWSAVLDRLGKVAKKSDLGKSLYHTDDENNQVTFGCYLRKCLPHIAARC